MFIYLLLLPEYTKQASSYIRSKSNWFIMGSACFYTSTTSYKTEKTNVSALFDTYVLFDVSSGMMNYRLTNNEADWVHKWLLPYFNKRITETKKSDNTDREELNSNLFNGLSDWLDKLKK